MIPLRVLALACIAATSAPLLAQETAAQADSLFTRAKLHYSKGQLDSALLAYRMVASIDHALGDKEGEGNTLYNIGIIYSETGFPDSALMSYRSALAIHNGRKNRHDEAKVLSTIGEIFHTVGRPDSAFYYYRTALRIRRGIADVEGEAETINNIGNLYLELGWLDSALIVYRSALAMARQTGSKGGEAGALENLARILLEQGNPDSALATYRQALRVAQDAELLRSQAAVLESLGSLFSSIRSLDSALYYYRAATRLHYKLDDREATAAVFNNIGLLFVKMDRPDSALFHYRVALPLWRIVRNRQGEAGTLRNMGYLYAVAGTAANHFITAASYYDSAAAIYAAIRVHSGPDANAVAYAEQQRSTFDEWAHTWLVQSDRATGRERERAMYSALSAAERGRAQGLRQLLTARAGADRSARVAGDASSKALLGFGRNSADTIPGVDLLAEANQLLAPLRQSHTTGLYYLFGPDSLTIWLLESSGTLNVLRSASLDSDSLALFVTTLRRGVGADLARTGMVRAGPRGIDQEKTVGIGRGVEDDAPNAEATLRAARALSAHLLPANLMRSVPAGAEVVIVPQGILGLVPFAALTVPGDTIPMGIRFAIRYAPSLRAVNAAEEKSPGGVSALVVADPAMPLVSDVGGNRVRLRNLPAARKEGTKVAQLFGSPLLADSQGSETEVRRRMPRARFVHLATHGLAFGSEARVRDSYVALAPDTVNDGLLTIGELIDEVPALTSDLVVLSACQTGLGNLQEAEGTVGFQRAFLAKGARSVLVSLWSVDDEATALLMERFYSHWLGSNRQPVMSKAEALRQAQGDVRSTPGYESPRFWAAFQLVGAR